MISSPIQEDILFPIPLPPSSSSSSQEQHQEQQQSTQFEESNIWGLLQQKGKENEYKLFHRIKDGRRDVYTIGRASTCDIVINNSQINSIHCLIYCDYLDERLAMFVNDCSLTGTYVNNNLTKLSNGERTELKSGDEIFLTNPSSSSSSSSSSSDVDMISFIFINMRERLFVPKKVDTVPLLEPFLTNETKDNQLIIAIQRRIEDCYVIGDEIGHGMCGKVHICTHKNTMKQYAVKIIDTKKFSKTPGLSPSELRREAELMRNLKHPNIIQIQVITS